MKIKKYIYIYIMIWVHREWSHIFMIVQNGLVYFYMLRVCKIAMG